MGPRLMPEPLVASSWHRTGASPAVVVKERTQVLWFGARDRTELALLLDGDDYAVCALGAARARSRGRVIGAEHCRLGIVDPDSTRLAMARRAVMAGKPRRGADDIWFSPSPLLAEGRLGFVFPGIEPEVSLRTDDIAERFGMVKLPWPPPNLSEYILGWIEAGKLLDKALRRIGVIPDIVAGASIGEMTAAVSTGLVDGARAKEYFDTLTGDSLEVPGYGFAAVAASARTVTNLLDDYAGMAISHDNSPSQCIVNGPDAQLAQLMAALGNRHIQSRRMSFRSAFHTAQFGKVLQSTGVDLRSWDVHPVATPLWSSTTAAPFPSEPEKVRELFLRNMVGTVRLRETVEVLYTAGVRVFLQIGPGKLASVVRSNLRGREHLSLPVNVGSRSGIDQLRRVATAVWTEGGAPNLRPLDE